MYETLSYLPTLFFNQTYDSYVTEHLFKPLNMTSSTYSVAEAESWGTLANGFMYDMEDVTQENNGTLKATVPYFLRPGGEMIWAGAGGVLTSTRDLVRPFLLLRFCATWLMLVLGKMVVYVNERRSKSCNE